MKRKHNEGSSFIEVLVGIVVLALIVVPTCTSLVMSARINAKAEKLLQDQLAVSSAVETLMAEGYKAGCLNGDGQYNPDTLDELEFAKSVYSKVKLSLGETNGDRWVTITVSSKDNEVSVTTQVKKTETGGGSTE